MDDRWQHQLRVYLTDAGVDAWEHDRLRPLADVLRRHDAAMVSQLDAFANYLAEAQREGPDAYPLYRWTEATLADPVKRSKHRKAFALHVAGQAVYPKEVADALEAELQPLVDDGLVARLSRQDTNPANNLPVPPEYRA